MDTISSKMTLYDMLSMVIPGFLLLTLISFCCNCQFIIRDNEMNAVTGIIFFIASYMVGLIYHKAVEYLFNESGFRNNQKSIEKSAENFLDDFKKDGGNAEEYNTSLFNKYEYYKAYYTLMKNNMLHSSIPVMEAQVAFIRNMLLIMLFYIIALCCCRCSVFCINPCILVILLLITTIALMMLLFKIQNKIYYLVWEGKTYLDEIQKTEKTNTEK